MKDRYDRDITNIRISLTQNCELDCFYCHEEGESDPDDSELSVDDVDSILRTASELGMSKVKFSGGEPLVHPDIVEIIGTADKYMDDISLTTNGVKLEGLAEGLKSNGLDRVNVSLDTLDRERYERITGHDRLPDVIDGIKKAADTGLFPVKINTLLMKGMNEDEIEELIEFSSRTGAVLQIIEMTGDEEAVCESYYKKYHIPLDEIADGLEERAVEIRERKMHARKKYMLDDPKAEVELVKTMHNSRFCANCTRLRVTSKGELKPCLLRTDNHVDIRAELDSGEDLKDKFIEAINYREPYWCD